MNYLEGTTLDEATASIKSTIFTRNEHKSEYEEFVDQDASDRITFIEIQEIKCEWYISLFFLTVALAVV
jgi:hypothetical protein